MADFPFRPNLFLSQGWDTPLPTFPLSTIHTLGSQVCTNRLHRCEPPRQTLVYQNATEKRTRHFRRVFATTEGEECRVRISAGRQSTPKEPLRAVRTEADKEEKRHGNSSASLSPLPRRTPATANNIPAREHKVSRLRLGAGQRDYSYFISTPTLKKRSCDFNSAGASSALYHSPPSSEQP